MQKYKASTLEGEVAEAVKVSRNTFLKQLESLPEALGSILIEHYKKRVERGYGKLLLGESAPWLLADLLSIRRREVIPQVAISWLNIYAYVCFIDDIIDHQVETDRLPYLQAASGVLLSKGIASLYQLTPDNRSKKNIDYLNELCSQTAYAAIMELKNHKGGFRSFSSSELDDLGYKASLLKLCAASLLIADGITEIDDRDSVIVHKLCTGMQLMDNLSDWQEDWNQKNYTYPITTAITRIEKIGINDKLDMAELTDDEVLTAMVMTGALEQTLTSIEQYLEEIIKMPALEHNTPGFQFLEGVIRDCTWLRNHVADIRRLFIKERSFCTEADWLRKLVLRKNVDIGIKEVKRGIQIVAQNS